jgi:hypothetical protein
MKVEVKPKQIATKQAAKKMQFLKWQQPKLLKLK